MSKTLMTSAVIVMLLSVSAADSPEALLTVAERSGFKATATHVEVVALLDRLAAASPLVSRTSLGRSGEGREIPAVIISDPPLATPAEAARQIRREHKLVVMAIGNIHGGEVCGKEALGMLARELAATPSHPLLQDLIIIRAPIYNADGNERMDKGNRRG
ncbi:MAG: M14 family zinc carboxypeptidase, partial [Phycisphaerae bacterium]